MFDFPFNVPLFQLPQNAGMREHGDSELVRLAWLADASEVWAPVFVGDARAFAQCVAFDVTEHDALVVSATPVRVYEARVKLRDLRVPRCSPFAAKE